jgi:hypothetical protein
VGPAVRPGDHRDAHRPHPAGVPRALPVATADGPLGRYGGAPPLCSQEALAGFLSHDGLGPARPLKASPSGGLRPALTGLVSWRPGGSPSSLKPGGPYGAIRLQRRRAAVRGRRRGVGTVGGEPGFRRRQRDRAEVGAAVGSRGGWRVVAVG